MVRDRALSVDAMTWDDKDEENDISHSSLQPDISQQESEYCHERRVQSPVFQALRCTDNDTFIGADRCSDKGVVGRLLNTSLTDAKKNSGDEAAPINRSKEISSAYQRSLSNTSPDMSMTEQRGYGYTTADYSPSSAREATIYDDYEDRNVPTSRETSMKMHGKIQERERKSEREKERESRLKPTRDAERQHNGKLEWQDFMASISGGSLARTRPQFPASLSTPNPTLTYTSITKSMSESQSQSQMKSDKGLSKPQSATNAKKHRQCLVIGQSKSVQTFELKQTNVNKFLSIDRGVTNPGHHVARLRRKSQLAKESSCGSSSRGKKFNLEAMLSDLNPSAIQLGFLY